MGGTGGAAHVPRDPVVMDPHAYEEHHGFVWGYGVDLLGDLDPRPGEHILDLGCGGGQLTSRVADAGSVVTGVDRDPDLIALARERFPTIRWIEADIATLALGETFDAVFSNAALHWLPDPGPAVRVVAGHLAPGGRMVAELGGADNCRGLIEAIQAANPDPAIEHPWYFPTEEEYCEVLASAGLDPVRVTRFHRPTRLEGGPSAWVRAFCSWATRDIEDLDAYLQRVEELARPSLWKGDHWVGDYVRLRVVARKP